MKFKSLAFIALSFFISTMAVALPRVKRLDTAVNNLDIVFGSLPLVSEVVRPKTLIIDNRSSKEIEVNCSHLSSLNAPPTSEWSALYVAGSSAIAIDNPDINGSCWVRAVPSKITSGIVVITSIGEN